MGNDSIVLLVGRRGLPGAHVSSRILLASQDLPRPVRSARGIPPAGDRAAGPHHHDYSGCALRLGVSPTVQYRTRCVAHERPTVRRFLWRHGVVVGVRGQQPGKGSGGALGGGSARAQAGADAAEKEELGLCGATMTPAAHFQFVMRRRRSRCILGIRGVMKYKIALKETNEGYSVSVPGLPGCWSQGATEQEAVANIQDAIREYLAVREDLLKGAVIREVEVA